MLSIFSNTFVKHYVIEVESGLKKAPNFDCSCSQKFHFFGLKFQKNIRPQSVSCFKNFDWLTVITRAYNQCKTKKITVYDKI